MHFGRRPSAGRFQRGLEASQPQGAEVWTRAQPKPLLQVRVSPSSEGLAHELPAAPDLVEVILLRLLPGRCATRPMMLVLTSSQYSASCVN